MNRGMRGAGLALVVATWTMASVADVAGAQVESPEAVAKRGIDAARTSDWPGYTAVMHPEALAALKEMFRPIVAIEAGGEFRKMFFGVETTEQFEALTDAGAFEALMKSLSTNVPGFAEAMASAQFEPIGTLPEGAELVHLVYRTDAATQGLKISKTSVLTLRRYEGQWRMLLSGSIEGIAQRLAAMTGEG